MLTGFAVITFVMIGLLGFLVISGKSREMTILRIASSPNAHNGLKCERLHGSVEDEEDC